MKSSDRIIVWALAISLAIHAVVLTAVRFTRPVEAQEPKPTRVSIQTTIHVPPPTPTPKPVTQPTQTQPHNTTPNVNVTKTKTIAKGGPGENTPGPASTSGPGDVGPVATGSAEPTATPKPRCSTPYAPATVINAMPAEAPQGAEGETGTAQVKVDLSAAGSVLGVEIYKAAGNMLLDHAALHAARASTYKAETRDCESVGGSYLFTVDFVQQ